jgi:hypothetical protein
MITLLSLLRFDVQLSTSGFDSQQIAECMATSTTYSIGATASIEFYHRV